MQEEIRYFGIEMGSDSHRPASPAQTLARRFGDCKAKALLLVQLLDELGIEAHPALVDTSGRVESPTHPWRLHAFDHVIVRVVDEGTVHFVDPTRTHERGALGDVAEPDYGAALVLAPGVGALEPMRPERHAAPMRTDKRLIVSADPTVPTSLEVRTRYPAARAGHIRARIEREGARAIDESYLEHYDDTLGDVERAAPMRVHELDDGGLELVERYTMALWPDDDTEVRRRWLRAAELDDEPVSAPEDDGPALPLSIREAWAHVERWTITMPRPVEVLHARAHENTPWFRLTESLEIDEDDTTVVVETRFEPLADEVAAGDVAAYRAAFDRLQDAVDFELVDRPEPTGLESLARRFADTSEDESDATFAAELGALGAGLLAVGIATVRRRREARAEDGPGT